MPFTLHPYAAVIDGAVSRFIDDPADLLDGEIALPVIADADPPLAPDERLFGPDYEVFADHVRAFGTAVKAEPETIQTLTFAQLLIGLVAEGWITETDGEGWLAGRLPAPVLALIGTLPAEMQFPAKARAIRPSEVIRRDPLVEMLGASQGKTAQELDAFFVRYSQV